ncbi:MAG: exodeoxyribonuclease VII large subunit [Gemmatimonadaceae bacterium]
MHLVVMAFEASGDGLWRKALDESVKRLTAEGLLDPARKRRVSAHPRRIAVVTSPDGAALRDIIAVVQRRCPIVEIVVVPARVQGDGAARELVSAIRRVSRWRDVDTVIVGRGGGSREDLWVFNDERVARALAACAIPTISAVGHEVDVSLCDLVADLRAATPSAAAEAAVPVLADLHKRLASRAVDLRVGLERRAIRERRHFAATARTMRGALERLTARRRSRFEIAAGRLDALSPLATLGRGYALATDESGHALTNAAQFEVGRAFQLRLRDGEVGARTESAAVTPAVPKAEG